MPDLTIVAVGLVVEELRRQFDPASENPPMGGGTADIRVIGGDMVPLDGFDSADCALLVWVRLARRYRTTAFPAEAASGARCGSQPVIVLEAGVARCADMGDDNGPPAPSVIEREALVQMDDAWRVDAALCRAAARAEDEDIAPDCVLGAGEPYGPEGGVIAWFQTATFELEN